MTPIRLPYVMFGVALAAEAGLMVSFGVLPLPAIDGALGHVVDGVALGAVVAVAHRLLKAHGLGWLGWAGRDGSPVDSLILGVVTLAFESAFHNVARGAETIVGDLGSALINGIILAIVVSTTTAWLEFIGEQSRRHGVAVSSPLRMLSVPLLAGVVLAAISVAVVPTASHYVAIQRWSRLDVAADIVNLAGRQRMYSQMIGRLAALPDADHRARLWDAVRESEEQLAQLQALVSAFASDRALSDAERSQLPGGGASVELHRAYVARAKDVLLGGVDGGGVDGGPAARGALQDAIDAFLPEMERSIDSLEALVEGEILDNASSERMSFRLDPLVLFALALAMMWPVLRLVGAQQSTLSEQARILDRTKTPVALMGPDGEIERANPAFEALVGQSFARLKDRPLSELIRNLGGGEEVAGKLAYSVRDAQPLKILVCLPAPRGARRWLDLELLPLFGERAQLLGFQALAYDVTALMVARLRERRARKEAEKALGDVSAYQAALDEHSIVSISDAKGVITYANEKFSEISGYSNDELVGSNHSIVNSGAHPRSFFVDMWRTIGRGRSWRGTICNRGKDGRPYWVDTTIVPLTGADGRPERYVSIRYDITDRVLHEDKVRLATAKDAVVAKFLELAAQDSDEKDYLEKCLSTLISQTPWLALAPRGGIFLTSTEDQNELTLVASHDLYPEINTLCARVKFGHCLCGRAAAARKSQHASCVDERHETTFAGMSGHGHYNIPLLEDDKTVGVLVLYLAEGHRKQADEIADLERLAELLVLGLSRRRQMRALADRTREAVAASVEKSRFLATMSHEIRTPMNGVLGMAQTLAKTPLSADQREMVDVINASGASLMTVINDILDLSKIEAGKVSLESIEFSLDKLLGDAVALFRVAASEKGLDLKLRVLPEASGDYLGDPTRIGQILANLVSNAIKFTSAGEVEISAERRGAADGGAERILISVRDSGVGIPPERRGVLFAAFTQQDASTTRRYGGTGLGLAISRRLCELMGGWIDVDSRAGEGSTFRFELPLKHAERPAVEGRSREPSPGQADYAGAGLRILVAEDNKGNRLVMKAMLAQMGLAADFVENGRDAAAACEATRYDVVFMDTQMPVMGGLEATQLIREAEAAQGRPRAPIVSLSADVMDDQVERQHAAGMDLHVGKPISAQKLNAAIAEALSLRGGVGEAPREEDGVRTA